jgi:MoaA/NifB/PqqE/SkfB family radical SAM enzyme
MATTLVEPTSMNSSSLLEGLKARFWSGLEQPEGYIRSLRWLVPLVSQEWLWSDRRLLHRLASLERIAFWKGEEWRSDGDVEQTRKVFLRALREVAGPRLKLIVDEGDRRRVNQWLAKVEARLGVIDPYCRPTRARLELTDACNLRCPMCPQSFWEWDRNYAGDWILERARSLYPWLTSLDFTSFGETLLSPLFKKAVREAPAHTHTLLITNGLLVNDEMAAFLCSHHISELHVSIDAASQGPYLAMRCVDGFDRVVENCRRLVKARLQTGRGSPTLVFNFTLNRKNIEELVPLIRLAGEIGFQRVHINYLMVWTSDLRGDSVYWIRERTCEVIDHAERVAQEVGVEFFHPPRPLKEHEGVERFERYCPEAWEFIHLRAHGRLSVCCMSADEFEVPEGMDWEEVWDSPAYQDFRRRVNLPGDEAPPLCRNCFFGRNIQPGDPRFHFFDEALSEHVTGSPKDPYLRERLVQ